MGGEPRRAGEMSPIYRDVRDTRVLARVGCDDSHQFRLKSFVVTDIKKAERPVSLRILSTVFLRLALYSVNFCKT